MHHLPDRPVACWWLRDRARRASACRMGGHGCGRADSLHECVSLGRVGRDVVDAEDRFSRAEVGLVPGTGPGTCLDRPVEAPSARFRDMTELPTTPLGRTGVEVTKLGYGSMELRGGESGPAIDEDAACRF